MVEKVLKGNRFSFDPTKMTVGVNEEYYFPVRVVKGIGQVRPEPSDTTERMVEQFPPALRLELFRWLDSIVGRR